MSLRRKIGWDELERAAGIRRTDAARPTQNDAKRLEQKMLKWRRKRGRS